MADPDENDRRSELGMDLFQSPAAGQNTANKADATIVPSQPTSTRFEIDDPNHVAEAHVRATRLGFWIILALVGLGGPLLILFNWIFGDDIDERWLYVAGPWLIIVIALLWLTLKWPQKVWERLTYRVDASGIEIKSGVIWRSSALVACSRIQHTEISRGPIQRRFKLADLLIHTAGTANETVTLPGLEEETAIELRDWLIAESAHARKS